jgi:hypothetical protein
MVAAVGLAAFGGGLGLGLMLARVLILAGFLISLASAAAIVWIYFQHFLTAYRALVKRAKYKGPNIKELVVAAGMLIVLIPLSASVFAIVSKEEAPPHRGILGLGTPILVPIPGGDKNHVNITLSNIGDLSIVHPATAVGGWIRDALAPIEETNREMTRLRDDLKQRDKPGPSTNRIVRNTGAVVTIPGLQPTNAEWAKISDGKAALYVFVVARYSDEKIEDRGYWEMETCAWFITTFSFWHNCSENRTEFVKGSRY